MRTLVNAVSDANRNRHAPAASIWARLCSIRIDMEETFFLCVSMRASHENFMLNLTRIQEYAYIFATVFVCNRNLQFQAFSYTTV